MVKSTRRKFYRKKKMGTSAARKMISKYVGPVRKLSIPRRITQQIFPYVWRNRHARTYITNLGYSQSGGARAGIIHTFKGNSFYQAGPLTDNSGSFATNVPAGLQYVISTNDNDGTSAAPYTNYRIVGSRITLYISSAATNTMPMKVALFPSRNPNTSGMSFNSFFPEQPHSVFKDIPANTTTKSLIVSNTMSTMRMFGVTPTRLDDPEYSGTATSNPTNTWYWQFYIITVDGSNGGAYAIEAVIDYHFDCHSINQFDTAVPT